MRKKCIQLVTLSLLILILSCCAYQNTQENTEFTNESQSHNKDSTSQGVEFFQGTYEEALALAEQEDKLVFVYFYYEVNRPSIVMRDVVFRRPEVGQYFNDRFVNYQAELEEAERRKSAIMEFYSYFVIKFPVYLILDSDGNLLAETRGSASPSQIISVISRALGETDSDFAAMQKRYNAGDRSTEFIQQYLMNSIEELAFQTFNGHDEESIKAYRDERAKYKKIADEYFNTKPKTDLINETDSHLIMYFYWDAARGDEIVDFVLDHYDEFLKVSSKTAMALFTLETTYLGVYEAAQIGDEKFVEYFDSLKSYPLNQAIEYFREQDYSVDPDQYFPRCVWYGSGTDYLKAKGNWDQDDDVYLKHLEKCAASANRFDLVARVLLEPEEPPAFLQRAAVEYSRRAYELDQTDPQIVATHISALLAVGKMYSAVLITEQYRKKMSRTPHGRVTLKEFESLLAATFEEKIESSP